MPSLPFRYVGTKKRLGGKYARHFPSHRTYVDVCGGTGALFFHKPPSKVEIYNDIDGTVTNVFEVLQNRVDCEELLWLLENTPNARQQYEDCKQVVIDPAATKVRRAWAFLVCAAIGFCGHPVVQHGWISPRHAKKHLLTLPKTVLWWRERFRQIYVENKPWQEIIDLYDAPDTFFFVDPPYLPQVLTSQSYKYYTHMMTVADHIELIERLRAIKGHAFLCGYNHPIYTERLFHWRKLTFEAMTTMGGNKREKRTECAWLNYTDDGSKIEGNRLRIARRYIQIMGGEEEARKYLERIAQLRRLPK